MQSTRGTHWPSVLQFVYSAGGLAFWLGAAGLAAAGAWAGVTAGLPAGADLSMMVFSAGNLAFIAILFLPPLVYAFIRILGKPAPILRIPALTPLAAAAVLLAWALAIILGSFISNGGQVESFLLFPFYLLGICLPVLLLTWAAAGGLNTGSAQRSWGLLSTGMLLSPAIVLVVELVLALVALAYAVAYFIAHPDTATGFSILAQRLANASNNPDLMQRILLSYLRKPAVVISLLAYLAVFTPLLEEMFKTAGVWVAGIRSSHLDPAYGFAAGALSGAGFTLVESLNAAAGALGRGWEAILLARAGTDLLHILTGALMGWAVVSAVGQRRYLRLLGTYLGVVVLHGLWNALSVSTGILSVLNQRVPGIPDLPLGGSTAFVGLGVLSLGMLLLLLRLNARMRREARLPAAFPAAEPALDLPAGQQPLA